MKKLQNFKEQFIYLLAFLRNSNVRHKLKNYHDLRNKYRSIPLFEKDGHLTDPTRDNETVISINEKVLEQLLQLKPLLLKRGGYKI